METGTQVQSYYKTLANEKVKYLEELKKLPH